MSLYLLINDIHATERAPSSCTDTYLDDLLDLLAQTVTIAAERNAGAVVWAGDVFHHKAPSRSSHRLVQRLIALARAYPCPLFIVPGNHDLQNDRLDSLMVTQPLGVLLQAGAQMLDGWAEWDGPPGRLPVYGVPWLQGYGSYTEESDQAVGAALAEYRRRVTEAGTGTQHPLVVTHAPLYPPGRELDFEYFPADRWAEAMGGAGACWYGHVHEDHGDPYTAGGVTFANFGALSRGSLHEHNLTRQVCVGAWDSDAGRFERIPLHAKPAAQVFRLQEKAQVRDMQGRLDDFLASISSTQLEVLSTESVLAGVRGMGLGADAENLIEELLAGAADG